MVTLISNTQRLFCKQIVKTSQFLSKSLLSCIHEITKRKKKKSPNDTVLIHHKAQLRQVEGYNICLKYSLAISKV